MTDVHRKIELQEPEDLRYLVKNARRAAVEKLDEALPRIEGEDPYRRKVEELVREYLSQTFTSASSNILINGHPPSPTLLTSLLTPPLSTPLPTTQAHPVSEVYEPLDMKLHERTIALKAEEDALLQEIALLKKTTYTSAAERWNREYREGVERDEEVWREGEKYRDGEGEETRVGIGEGVRQERVEEAWRRGVEGLGVLKAGLPGTRARMERARGAGEYVLRESGRK